MDNNRIHNKLPDTVHRTNHSVDQSIDSIPTNNRPLDVDFPPHGNTTSNTYSWQHARPMRQADNNLRHYVGSVQKNRGGRSLQSSESNRSKGNNDFDRNNTRQNQNTTLDQLQYFNQEHKRLKDQILHEIRGKQGSGMPLPQENTTTEVYNDRSYQMLRNMVDNSNTDEFRRPTSLRNMKDIIRNDSLLQQRYRDSDFQTRRELRDHDWRNRVYANPIHQILNGHINERNNLGVSTSEGVSEPRIIDLSCLEEQEQDSRIHESNETSFTQHMPTTAPQELQPLIPHNSLTAMMDVDASTFGANLATVVDLTDEVDVGDDDAPSSAYMFQLPPNKSFSFRQDEPINKKALDENFQDNLRFSMLVNATKMQTLDSSVSSHQAHSLSTDNHGTSPIPFSLYSHDNLAKILTTLKRNNELFTMRNSNDILDFLPKLPSESTIHHVSQEVATVESEDPTSALAEGSAINIIEMTGDVVSPTFTETWWPSSRTNGEKITPKNQSEPSHVSVCSPLDRNSSEPGVLEKLPFCKLVTTHLNGTTNPLYCTQVTTMFCTRPMLCCSICYTWRHAECGGHYLLHCPRSKISNHSIDFQPVCDRCNHEKETQPYYPLVIERLHNHRLHHLRLEQLTSEVIKQAAWSTLNEWFVRSTSDSDLKNLDPRYEKACKEWDSMIDVIGIDSHGSKKKVHLQESALKLLLSFLERAEEVTDYHNMILFLQRDTSRKFPVGMEDSRINIFDPLDNPQIPCMEASEPRKKKAKRKEIIVSGHETSDDEKLSCDEESVAINTEASKMNIGLPISSSSNTNRTGRHANEIQEKLQVDDSCNVCIRHSCTAKRRFDSLFCSDACGVASMELDLLRSLSSLIHLSYDQKNEIK